MSARLSNFAWPFFTSAIFCFTYDALRMGKGGDGGWKEMRTYISGGSIPSAKGGGGGLGFCRFDYEC